RRAILARHPCAGLPVFIPTRPAQGNRAGHLRHAARRFARPCRTFAARAAGPLRTPAGFPRPGGTGHGRARPGFTRLGSLHGPGIAMEFPPAARFAMNTLHLRITFEDGQQKSVEATTPLLIGRAAQCGLRIANWRVAKHHARLVQHEQIIELEDLGSFGGTFVNGHRVAVHRPVLPGDDILIGPCRIRVTLPDAGLDSDTRDRDGPGAVADTATVAASVQQADGAASQALLPHRRRLHAALLQALDLRRRDVAGMSDGLLRSEAQHMLDRIAADDAEIPASVARAALCRDVLDEAVGLGPLEPLLTDSGISEIMVNRHDEIYIERGGRLLRHNAAFSSEQSVRWAIERIVA